MMVRTVVRDISTVDGKRQMLLHSTNELLIDPDVNGVKTGYTSKAGRCLIASMFKDGHRLLFVGLNVMDRWEQATSCSDTDRWHCETRIGLASNSSNQVEVGVTEIFLASA